MQVSRKERQELDELSKEVFGSKSRWQKLCDSGYEEALTEEKEEATPCDKEGGHTDECTHEKTQKIKVPVRATASGGVKYVTKYHTPESVKKYMLDMKKNFEEIRAKIKQHQDEIRAQRDKEERDKELQKEAGGSAV